MKKFLKYLYKHLATTITILITVITAVVVNCIPNIGIGFLDNFIIAAVIALNVTFLFDFTRNMDNIESEITDLKGILPSSRIKTYNSVDKVAKQLCEMVNEGRHNVDIVLFDTKIRTSNPKKVSEMVKFIRTCSENERIRLRLAFVPAADSICQRIESILDSEKKKRESYYAYQESKMTFASFMVIDSSFVSIRTPFKNGSPTCYCIVREADLCALYSSWFNILWEEAVVVNKDTLLDFIEKYENLIPNDKIDNYKTKAKDLIK